jgi:hypothetical protein
MKRFFEGLDIIRDIESVSVSWESESVSSRSRLYLVDKWQVYCIEDLLLGGKSLGGCKDVWHGRFLFGCVGGDEDQPQERPWDFGETRCWDTVDIGTHDGIDDSTFAFDGEWCLVKLSIVRRWTIKIGDRYRLKWCFYSRSDMDYFTGTKPHSSVEPYSFMVHLIIRSQLQ